MIKLGIFAAKVATKARSRAKAVCVLPQKWELRAAYNRGRTHTNTNARSLEPAHPYVIELGQSLRDRALKEYELKYRESGCRILFHMPPSGVGAVWFSDLMQCLDHVGIACTSLHWKEPDFRRKWQSFQPNVFITMDHAVALKSLDLDYIEDYKKEHGCLRLFTPIAKHRFPKPGLSLEDRHRLDLARAGKTADAYFSMMAPEFYREFFGEWAEAGFKYLALPNGCNPFRHYPVGSAKEFDYFMVTSYGPQRVMVTARYMKRIFENYYGLWAGPEWGFGEGAIPRDKLRTYYARARIAPNPLMPYLIRFPAETTERSFSATACGAFQITNRTPVTDRFFAPNELVLVTNEKEFFDAFAHYVYRPEERNEIVLKGMKRVFSDHTYFQRIDSLVSFLAECRGLF